MIMTTMTRFLAVFAVALAMFTPVLGNDPGQLQDFCVAIGALNNAVFVNGKFCKNPNLATPNDFLFTGLQVPRTTSNPLGSTVTPVFADQLPGLNTLGISLARIDFGIGGLVPPHTHPRATEILLVLEGTLYVGFVTSDPNNRLFAKVLYPGDAFVFPEGLIHFQLNVGKTPAASISGLSSQNPGVITVANALFNSTPPITPEVLAKALRLDEMEVEKLQKDFAH